MSVEIARQEPRLNPSGFDVTEDGKPKLANGPRPS